MHFQASQYMPSISVHLVIQTLIYPFNPSLCIQSYHFQIHSLHLILYISCQAFYFMHLNLCILSCESPRICIYHLLICTIVYTYNSYHFIIWNLIFHIVQTDRHFQVKSCYRSAAEKHLFAIMSLNVCYCSQSCLYMTASGAYTQGTIRCRALCKE